MKLPQLNATPKYTVKLQSITDPVEFRTFLVKEQKILLMAAQSKDPDEILGAMFSCIENCTYGKIDVKKLPSFDLIMLFLKIRSKSVGEILELRYTCDHKIETDDDSVKICGTNVEFTINLEDIGYDLPEGHTNLVSLTDSVGVKLRYPTLESSKDISKDNPSSYLSLIVDSIESIFTDDQIVESKEVSKQELIDFVDNFDTKQLEEVMKFFSTQPRVHHECEVHCPKCGTSKKLELSDINDFF